MNTRKWTVFKFVFIILSLLLGQALSGAVTAEQADGEAAGYWSFIPVVTRYLGFRESTGVLDPSFAGQGYVRTDFGYTDVAEDLVLQPDGKIVAAGQAFADGDHMNFALARYNPDGSLDSNFGSGGKVVTDFDLTSYAYAVALQPDGKIVAAGWAENDVYPYHDIEGIALARYQPNGSLDMSFGEDGKLMTDVGLAPWGRDLVLQADGKIVVAASAYFEQEGTWMRGFVLVRYLPDGSLDSSFDGDGIVTTSFNHFDDIAYEMAIQPDGKILVVGRSVTETYVGYFAMARYNPDGSLDETFTGDGKLTIADLGCQAGYTIALQEDGKIVIASAPCGDEVDFVLQRYTADGSLDTGFGEAGSTWTDWGGNEVPTALRLQPDGKIVAAGEVTMYGGGFSIVIARYHADGSLDESFGYYGQVLTDISQDDEVNALAIQRDGRIVLAGALSGDMGPDFVLVRYK